MFRQNGSLMTKPAPVQAETNYTPAVIPEYAGPDLEGVYGTRPFNYTNDLGDATHGAVPGTDPMGFAKSYDFALPDPTVGASTGVAYMQGSSGGSYSWAQRFAPFTGIVTSPPSVAYTPSSGPVGTDTHQQNLFAGVTSQLTGYVPNTSGFAQAYLGPVPMPQFNIAEGTNL